jgi:hypothetical protein
MFDKKKTKQQTERYTDRKTNRRTSLSKSFCVSCKAGQIEISLDKIDGDSLPKTEDK